MEVTVAAAVVVAEEDDGVGAGGDVVEELVLASVGDGSRTEVSTEESGRPCFCAGWS
jgi:hypothetical protein